MPILVKQTFISWLSKRTSYVTKFVVELLSVSFNVTGLFTKTITIRCSQLRFWFVNFLPSISLFYLFQLSLTDFFFILSFTFFTKHIFLNKNIILSVRFTSCSQQRKDWIRRTLALVNWNSGTRRVDPGGSWWDRHGHKDCNSGQPIWSPLGDCIQSVLQPHRWLF